ncbi:PadR family transcriptional regulator [Bacillus cereus]|nr:PadR family transcriptional regulator [Bacillus cereus]TNO92250.1 PadR family transcriptional regulator [Bacillus cereus]
MSKRRYIKVIGVTVDIFEKSLIYLGEYQGGYPDGGA